jgi:hypothetical protein
MDTELKIIIQEILDLRIALINAKRCMKELRSLKHKDWHKLYDLDIHSIEKGEKALANIIQRS